VQTRCKYLSKLHVWHYLALQIFILCSLYGCGGTNSVPNPVHQTFGISGVVNPSTGGAGTSVGLNGAASVSTTADSSGNYSFTGLANGSYAVTPSHSGYSFSPTSQPVTISDMSVTGVNFTATAAAPTYTISGSVTPASSGAGSVMTLTGAASATTTADASGNYTFSALSNGSYTVTPRSQTATFSPTSQPVTISNGNMPSVNFAATASTNVIFFDDFTDPTLGPAWTVISRHGEYAQDETECNIPQEVSVANSLLTITTAVGPAICGDFNVDGSVRHSPASWPYITGDVQWQSFNFTYGTVTVRAKFPDKSVGLWPAIWMLGTNCQNTNPLTADTGYSTCPDISAANYTEIDMVECDLDNWCQLALANLANKGSGGQSFPTCGFPVDTNFHTFTLTWTASTVAVAMDGKSTGCSYNSPAWTIPSTPMFLIIQTQTGGYGGTPKNSLLPATFQVDFVKVTQP